jgi:hypothetical protein
MKRGEKWEEGIDRRTPLDFPPVLWLMRLGGRRESHQRADYIS